jgi:hypothetical protein
MYVLGSGLQVYVKVCVYFARVRHTHRAQWWMHDNTSAIGFVTSSSARQTNDHVSSAVNLMSS